MGHLATSLIRYVASGLQDIGAPATTVEEVVRGVRRGLGFWLAREGLDSRAEAEALERYAETDDWRVLLRRIRRYMEPLIGRAGALLLVVPVAQYWPKDPQTMASMVEAIVHVAYPYQPQTTWAALAYGLYLGRLVDEGRKSPAVQWTAVLRLLRILSPVHNSELETRFDYARIKGIQPENLRESADDCVDSLEAVLWHFWRYENESAVSCIPSTNAVVEVAVNELRRLSHECYPT